MNGRSRWYEKGKLKEGELGECMYCHGSGTRTVTLEGWVRVDYYGSGREANVPQYGDLVFIGISHFDEDGVSSYRFDGDSGEPEGACQDLHDKITEALQSNTCPDAIRAQLHEVQP